jgi:hypothetical protein
MIEHLRTILGYCAQCHEPALVGEFRLKGWKHVFCLCNVCLRKLSETTVNGAATGSNAPESPS